MSVALRKLAISGDYRDGVELAGGCGTIARPMSGSRWLALLTLVAALVLGASSARAQVFRPRNGKAAPVNKAALAAAAATPVTAKKAAAPAPTAPAAAAASKKTAHTAETNPRRTGATHKKKRAKARGDADSVVIDDDEDEDVKITDD